MCRWCECSAWPSSQRFKYWLVIMRQSPAESSIQVRKIPTTHTGSGYRYLGSSKRGGGRINKKFYRHQIPDPAKRICIFQPCSKEAGQLYGRWRHDKWMITGISFFLDVHSPEGRLFLLTSSKDGTVKAWDLKKGLCVESFRWTATCAHNSGCWRNAVVRKQKDAVGCWTFAK